MSRLWCGLTAEPCIKAGEPASDGIVRPMPVEPSDCPGVDSVVDRLQQIWAHVVDKLVLSQEVVQLFANRRISEIINPVSFRLALPASFAIHNVFHRSLLRKYVEPVVPSVDPPAPVLVDGELEYVVEKILDSRFSRRKLQYLVKWKGYGQEDNSWVFASDVHAADLVRAFHLARPDRPGGPGQVESSDCPGVDTVLDRLQQIWTHVVDNLTLSQEKAQRFANRRRCVGPRLRVGDLVWLSSRYVPMKVSSPKFKPRFIGPYKISEVINPVSFRLALPASFAIHNVFHRSLLRRYVAPVVPSVDPPAPVLVEGELEYVVEKILDSRVSRRKLQYLVKWKGYGQEDNSWVFASDVHAADLVRAFHLAHPGRPRGSGDYDKYLRDQDEQKIAVMKVFPHPYYLGEYYDHDIALLYLRSPAILSDYTRPICLPSPGLGRLLTQEGEIGQVSGWGATHYKGRASRFLLKVRLPIVSQDTCMASTDMVLTGNMFCAGYSIEARDSCKGDSGGPFAVIYRNTWYLVGVVSWGEGCAQEGKYGVYTRVSNYISWIKDIIIETEGMDEPLINTL
ncbi:unnamed protein product [Ranitomeya imitator]|uniref:Chromo domain-containing protein n=1 Tax=Ranitomeya imitator TaxID=111125 RepID=A0ABN9M4N0_9NEOB|nr:unnamed protein product [Ranitomeya imitator]